MTLRDYLTILGRWWWALLLGTALGAGGAFWMTSRITPVYESTAQMTVNQIQDPDGISYNTILGNQSLTVTYARLATSSKNLEKAVSSLAIAGLDANQLDGMVTARSIDKTFLIEVSAKDPDPVLAAMVANAVAEVFPEFILEVQLAGGTGTAVNTVFISEPAAPGAAPVSPNDRLNVILGAMLGLMVMVGAVALAEYMNDGIDEPEDIEAFDIPFLGTVLTAKLEGPKGRQRVASIWEAPKEPIAESFRQLHARLSFALVSHPGKVVVVTSSMSGEGKSTLAANLAEAMADSGKRVVLVDGDLRRPSVHRYFNLPNTAGLTSAFLAGPETAPSFLAAVDDQLGVLTSGPLPGSATDLLGSKRMAETIRVLAESVDLVIVDTPPLLGLADTSHWLTLADGVVIVARRGRTRQTPFEQALTVVSASGTPILGAVLNGVPQRAMGYYGYYYRYDNPDDRPPRRGLSRLLPFGRQGASRRGRRPRQVAEEGGFEIPATVTRPPSEYPADGDRS